MKPSQLFLGAAVLLAGTIVAGAWWLGTREPALPSPTAGLSPRLKTADSTAPQQAPVSSAAPSFARQTTGTAEAAAPRSQFTPAASVSSTNRTAVRANTVSPEPMPAQTPARAVVSISGAELLSDGDASAPRSRNDRAMELEIGFGAMIPASLAPSNPAIPLTPQQAAKKQQIAQDFLDTIAENQKVTDDPAALDAGWTNAQRVADQRLRDAVGKETYRQLAEQVYGGPFSPEAEAMRRAYQKKLIEQHREQLPAEAGL